MHSLLTPEQMRHVDASSGVAEETLIRRAGYAVAHVARGMMGGVYGRHVVVLAGKGNNGADGKVAGSFLRERGARVTVFDASSMPTELPSCDLVIDAVYGTGFRGEYFAPTTDAAVLAVDIPSGVNALTGEPQGRVLQADVTVTFAAVKPGLVLQPGRSLAGDIVVADIGLDIEPANEVDARLTGVVEKSDVIAWVPQRDEVAHKWNIAVRAVAGSKGMMGAAQLSCAAAYRAGAGIVHLSSLSATTELMSPRETVYRPIPHEGWGRAALVDIERFAAAFIGPGIGRGDELREELFDFVSHCPVPLVIDGDGLHLLGSSRDGRQRNVAEVLSSRRAPTVLTPHDGEFSALVGHRPSGNRIDEARQAAIALQATVLLKGSTTVVADSTGEAWCIIEGDERLATAGSGDVLTGTIAAYLARGMSPITAAAAGAFTHAYALRTLPKDAVMASDLLFGLGSAQMSDVDE
jgi:hydroxyethylthiazole kinase-like uncharacterized protein yjeF